MPQGDAASRVGLPIRPFLYTLDQIAQLIGVTQKSLELSYIHFEGRTAGRKTRHVMSAVNIAERADRPDWRVNEAEFIRWLKFKKIRIYERFGYDHR